MRSTQEENTLDPKSGEVFLCGEGTKGYFKSLQVLKGRYIVNFGGGYKQIFTIEDQILKDAKDRTL